MVNEYMDEINSESKSLNNNVVAVKWNELFMRKLQFKLFKPRILMNFQFSFSEDLR